MTSTAALTSKQARLVAAIDASAAQRDSYGKMARLAETLPGMELEVERMWASYNEMDADVDYRIQLADEAGVTPEMLG